MNLNLIQKKVDGNLQRGEMTMCRTFTNFLELAFRQATEEQGLL